MPIRHPNNIAQIVIGPTAPPNAEEGKRTRWRPIGGKQWPISGKQLTKPRHQPVALPIFVILPGQNHGPAESKTGIPEGAGFGRRPFIYAIPILRLAPASRIFMALSPISPSTDFDFEVARWLVGGPVLQGRLITRIAFMAICSGSVLWSASSCSRY